MVVLPVPWPPASPIINVLLSGLFLLIQKQIGIRKLLIILSLSIVGSLQTVGIVLVLSMLLIPAASAKLVCKTFIASIRISALFGGIASVSGLYLSYYFNLPSGPTMSLVASGLFTFSFIYKKIKAKAQIS